MKKVLAAPSFIIIILIFIFGCKEVPPFIDYSIKGIGLRDTTYMNVTVPPANNTVIFMEDLTGVRCNNCPKAALKIKEISVANPENVVAVAAYPWALKTLMDPYPGSEVLNTNEADDIFKNIYLSPSGIPGGGVNRKVFNGTSINTSISQWSGNADIIKVQESPVVIARELLKYDSISKKARIRVKVVFTKNYTEALNISVFLIESKILSKQLLPDLAGTIDDKYEHNHVLRKAVTSYNGIPLKIDAATTGNYLSGRTFEKDFEVILNERWKWNNCGFVILVNRFDDNSKEVLQASELNLK